MPSADPSLSLAERIDAACDGFEADWKAGRRPRIDDYVAAAPPSDRESLRQALLGVERELAGRGATDTSVARSSVRSGGEPSPATTVDRGGGSQGPPAAVGRFQIRGVLGSGAFGQVYRAFDPQLGREVALKTPLESAVRTDAERAQFLKEARAAATINHPNICQIHEVGEHGGRPYIVMALVPGQSLADVLKARKEPLPERQAALIVRKVALALAAAHDRGIVHRDLKPANVMFDRERKDVVVMDFGLARGPRLGDARATQSGVVMGTPAYMSPEQARGESKDVGPAGDVYGLGVILYELLTGTRPFAGTAAEVIGQILHVDPEPPSKRRPAIDRRLEVICLKAMAKGPASRYATMKQFATALDAFLRVTAPARPAAETARADQSRPNAGQPGAETLAEVVAALSADRNRSRARTAAAGEAAGARRRRPRRLLALAVLAFVVAIAGGLIGIGYLVHANGNPPAATQPPVVYQPPVVNQPPAVNQPVATQPTTTPPATSDKGATPPDKEPASRPIAFPATQTFFEDFAKAREGDLPAGWKADDGVNVRKQGDRPRLEAAGEGQRYVTLPEVSLGKNFFLECEFVAASDGTVELTLQGHDGGRDFPISAVASGGFSVYGASLKQVRIPEVDPKTSKTLDKAVHRLRLEREGDVFRLKVDGETIHARRLPGYGGFSGVRLALPGGDTPATKFYWIKLGPLADSPRDEPAPAEPDKAFRQGFRSDFQKAVEGDLPAGWKGDAAVAVRKGDRARLELAGKGPYAVTTPDLAVEGDFFLELELTVASGALVEVTLEGRSGGPDLPLSFRGSGGYANYGASLEEVRLAGLEPKTSKTLSSPEHRLRLEREGDVFRLVIDGETIYAQRLAGFKGFTRVRLSLSDDAAPPTRLFGIKVGPRG